MPIVIDVFLLALLALTAVALLRSRNLFAVAAFAGVYSLLSAGFFTVMDAVDVALTEAAVGAGISTVLLLGTLALVGREEAPARHSRLLPLAVAVVTGGILIYGTLDMPPYGRADNPAHLHVAPYYLERTQAEMGIPNVVSGLLAAYRGYDTLGETTVVLTAAVGVLALLTGSRGRRPVPAGPRGGEPPGGEEQQRPESAGRRRGRRERR